MSLTHKPIKTIPTPPPLLGCCEHPVYVTAASYGSEGASTLVTMDGVSLDGGSAKQRARRLRLYGVMMEGFSEEQRIHVTAKVCALYIDSHINRKGI